MSDRIEFEKIKLEAKPFDKVLAKVMEICPAAVQNGKVDFERLKAELADLVESDIKESYDFTWVGKREAIVEANTPISKTLRPCKEESVNWDSTENLYIEGDNLEVLKLLQESYLGKVKMIYIDPPYNTGKDFVYKDNFTKKKSDYEVQLGIEDEEGNKLFRNTETNGRFHSDWCSMIYPRLKLASDFLTDDGVIFISIDDHEVANLRKICDEVFGEDNFVAQIVVEGTPKNDPYIVSTAHEYCLVYVKNFEISKLSNYGIKNPLYDKMISIYNKNKNNYTKTEEDLKSFFIDNDLNNDNIKNYKYADKNGIFRTGPIDDPQSGGSKDLRINPNTGNYCLVPTSGWRCNISTWKEWIKHDLIIFPNTDDVLPSKKTYISSDRLDVMKAYFKIQTRKDTDNLKRLFGTQMTPFSNPKPIELIKSFIKNTNDKNNIIMDFFSGSATTAQAVMELNKIDSGKRKFILVQMPEIIDVKKSSSNKDKKIAKTAIDFLNSIKRPTNICEIGKERIRRAGAKIKESICSESGDLDLLVESKKCPDTGFRVLKLDDSNMKDVYYKAQDISQSELLNNVDNIKEGRTPLDLLFGVMLDWGVPLSLPLKEEMVGLNTVYTAGDNDLVACFDNNLSKESIEFIAKKQPMRAIFRDACFNGKDDAKINLAETFKELCNWDDNQLKNNVKVI